MSADKTICSTTRKHHSAEDKIRSSQKGWVAKITLLRSAAARGPPTAYISWSKEFLEAGKKRLVGDTARSATSDKVKAVRKERRDLKEALADLTLENRLQSMIGETSNEISCPRKA